MGHAHASGSYVGLGLAIGVGASVGHFFRMVRHQLCAASRGNTYHVLWLVIAFLGALLFAGVDAIAQSL
jgi:hypothetical protein